MAKKTAKKATSSRKMSAEHKEALARGREQGRTVRDYLAALSEQKKAGRRIDPDTLKQRIAATQEAIDAEPDLAKRVDLIQKRLDYEERLADTGEEADLDALEKQFVKIAKEYSERKDITYTAWREAGVAAAVVKEAGVPRTRRSAAA